MDKLWAPWRTAYLTTKQPRSCVFCSIKRSKADARNLVLKRTKHSIALLNLFPYNTGHLLILPLRHVSSPQDLNDVELLDLWRLVNQMVTKAKKALRCGGFNLGINLGRLAGAGIPGHLHVHIVPRWKGDANFMPITADTKVLSVSLKLIYKRFKGASRD